MAINSYLDNITSEHRDKPKFISWLSKNLTITDHIYLVLKSMDDNFDIDNAIGVQLDTLGTIIGRKRTLTFQPLNGFNPILPDDYYRLVLKSKIAMNNWDGTVPQMYQIWDDIFGNDDDLNLQLEDNQDMSFNAYITGYVDQIQQDLIQHQYIIPKPEGVRVNYIGRSKIPFDVYSGIVVCVCKTEVITMDFDQSEKIELSAYSRITVQQIKTETIHLGTENIKYTYLVNQEGKFLANKNGDMLII
jgi:hypothetical protein